MIFHTGLTHLGSKASIYSIAGIEKRLELLKFSIKNNKTNSYAFVFRNWFSCGIKRNNKKNNLNKTLKRWF